MRLPARLVIPLAVAGLGLSVPPATAGAPSVLPEAASERASEALSGSDDAAAPFDYIAQADQLSQPDYPEIVTTVEPITAFDGETLYVEITRPDPEVYPEPTASAPACSRTQSTPRATRWGSPATSHPAATPWR